MPLIFRTLFVLALGLFGGCLPAHPALQAQPEPRFRPAAFFEGPTSGTGTLKIRGRAPQAVRVESCGRLQPDGALVLDQTITFGQDAPRLRRWVFRTPAEGGYTAMLSESDGPVAMSTEGNELRIAYDARGLGTVEQRLFLEPGGRAARNLLTFRIAGVPWARIDERIVQEAERDGCPAPAPPRL